MHTQDNCTVSTMCVQLLYVSLMQDGQNALHIAAMAGHVSTIQYLAPKMQSLLHSANHKVFTMLHLAAQEGHDEVVRLLIDEYKLNPTARTKVCVWSHTRVSC